MTETEKALKEMLLSSGALEDLEDRVHRVLHRKTRLDLVSRELAELLRVIRERQRLEAALRIAAVPLRDADWEASVVAIMRGEKAVT